MVVVLRRESAKTKRLLSANQRNLVSNFFGLCIVFPVFPGIEAHIAPQVSRNVGRNWLVKQRGCGRLPQRSCRGDIQTGRECVEVSSSNVYFINQAITENGSELQGGVQIVQ